MTGSEQRGPARTAGTRVSVVVPVHDVEEFLEQCVESVLAQTHTDLDVVLVDDGSTDRSGEICDALADADPRVRVVHQPNAGLSAARNTGLSKVVGDWVTFLDSDDWWDPEFVSTLLGAVRLHPEAATAVAGFARVPGRPSSMPTTSTRLHTIGEALGLFAGPHHTLMTITCAKLFRRDLLDGVTFPEGRLHEDEFTTYRLLARAPVVVVPQPLYLYRQRPGTIASSVLTPERLLDALEAADQQAVDLAAWGHPAAASWAADQALRKRLRLVRLLRAAGRVDEAREHERILRSATAPTGGTLPLRGLSAAARVSPRAAALGLELSGRVRPGLGRPAPGRPRRS
ncbi:glycosyltransferase family 2 protein [Knoellia sp. CPCC 206450]|uniref:glycosyltransferase family 2 protein n=1 Tax=Knoellia tibetensis TaxID=3404798 RepID=UPI003B43AA2E